MLPVALVIALKGLAQIIGAVIAAAVVYSIFGSEMSASVTLPSENDIVRTPILGTVMTFTLVYVVLATATSRN
jgi:aquaporin Z